MRTTNLLIAPLILAVGLSAQEPALQTTTKVESALTIKTNEPDVAQAVMAMFSSTAELPEFGEGKVAVMSLDDGGQLNVSTGAGTSFLHVDARPAQLMRIYAAQVAQYQQMGQMMAGMGGAQMGLDFEDMSKIVTGLFSFPTQIDRVTVEIAESPEETKQLNLDAELTPIGDTWFGGLIESLEVNPTGVPTITDETAMVAFNMNVVMPKLWKALRPAVAPFAGMGQQSKEAKAAAARYMDVQAKAMEGTVSMTFDMTNGGLRAVAGLLSPDELSTIMKEPDYEKMQVAAGEIGDMAEASFEPSAFEHRGVTVAKMLQIFDDPQMSPFANEDGEATSFTAIAGKTLLWASGAGDAEVKALIDEVIDQRVKRRQLPPRALGVARIQLAQLFSWFEEMSGGQFQSDDDVPETMTAEIARTDKGLRLSIRTK